jgi:3-hydroxyacyl-[acyl-carrier-protein] dehydratase
MLFERDSLGPITHHEGGASARAVFPASWPVFAGHFPGRPIVPAYALLGLVLALAEAAHGAALAIASVDRMKLTRSFGPGEPVSCSLQWEGELRVRAQLSTASGEAAGMVLLSLREGS